MRCGAAAATGAPTSRRTSWTDTTCSSSSAPTSANRKVTSSATTARWARDSDATGRFLRDVPTKSVKSFLSFRQGPHAVLCLQLLRRGQQQGGLREAGSRPRALFDSIPGQQHDQRAHRQAKVPELHPPTAGGDFSKCLVGETIRNATNLQCVVILNIW